MNAAARPGI